MLDLVVDNLYTARIQLGLYTIHSKLAFIKTLDYNENNREYMDTEIRVIKQLVSAIPNEASRNIYDTIARKQIGDLYDKHDNKG